MSCEEQERGPSEELQHAIEDLSLFVEQNSDSPVPTLLQLDVKDGHLVASKSSSSAERMIDLTRQFFGLVFSGHSRQDQMKKQDKIRQTLLKAVATVSSYYPLIEKLKKGTSEEQRFAEGALEVIHRYNATITKNAADTPSWKSRFAEYLYKRTQTIVDEELKKSIVVLPTKASYESHPVLSSKKITQEVVMKSSVSQKFSNVAPSQHEVDAFRMKAITLINKQEISASTIQETVSSLKDAPIVAKHEDVEPERQGSSRAAIISFQQVLTPFPGEVIKLTGCFKRAPQTTLLSIPIPESFSVASQSTQTAFPHPLQHSGWALADVLIPHYPLRPDQLTLFHPMAEKKRKVAYALLPKGHLRAKAKQLIEAKRIAFDENSQAFVRLHKERSLSILGAADDKFSSRERIDQFYAYVEKHESPYDCLSSAYESLDEKCITSLYQRLHHEWLDVGHLGLRGSDHQKKSKCALALMQEELSLRLERLNNEEASSEVADYIGLMGRLLGQAAISIILQAMSEKIGMAPPMLTDFEQKVQACALAQVIHFLDEVSGVPIPDLAARMQDSLKYEAALFQTPSFEVLSDRPAEISNELEVYYNSRFYATKRS